MPEEKQEKPPTKEWPGQKLRKLLFRVKNELALYLSKIAGKDEIEIFLNKCNEDIPRYKEELEDATFKNKDEKKVSAGKVSLTYQVYFAIILKDLQEKKEQIAALLQLKETNGELNDAAESKRLVQCEKLHELKVAIDELEIKFTNKKKVYLGEMSSEEAETTTVTQSPSSLATVSQPDVILKSGQEQEQKELQVTKTLQDTETPIIQPVSNPGQSKTTPQSTGSVSQPESVAGPSHIAINVPPDSSPEEDKDTAELQGSRNPLIPPTPPNPPGNETNRIQEDQARNGMKRRVVLFGAKNSRQSIFIDLFLYYYNNERLNMEDINKNYNSECYKVLTRKLWGLRCGKVKYETQIDCKKYKLDMSGGCLKVADYTMHKEPDMSEILLHLPFKRVNAIIVALDFANVKDNLEVTYHTARWIKDNIPRCYHDRVWFIFKGCSTDMMTRQMSFLNVTGSYTLDENHFVFRQYEEGKEAEVFRANRNEYKRFVTRIKRQQPCPFDKLRLPLYPQAFRPDTCPISRSQSLNAFTFRELQCGFCGFGAFLFVAFIILLLFTGLFIF